MLSFGGAQHTEFTPIPPPPPPKNNNNNNTTTTLSHKKTRIATILILMDATLTRTVKIHKNSTYPFPQDFLVLSAHVCVYHAIVNSTEMKKHQLNVTNMSLQCFLPGKTKQGNASADFGYTVLMLNAQPAAKLDQGKIFPEVEKSLIHCS